MYNNINNNFIVSEKSNDYSAKFNSQQKLNSKKINKGDFQNILNSTQRTNSTNISKSVSNKHDLKTLKTEKDDGIDFALKKLSIDFEKQILGIMWNMAAQINKNFEGGLGEEIFYQELINEMVKLSKTGEMGDIAQSIYKDLKRKQDDVKNDE